MNSYKSLREKLVLPFVLLGFIVSALLSLITFGLVADLEGRAIERMLHVEMESFRHRQAINPAALPVTSTLLRGSFLPNPDFPLQQASIKTPYQDIQIIGDTKYSILADRIDGRIFALIYDRSIVDTNLANLALLLLLGTALMTLLSLLVGVRLSEKVLYPIVRLIAEVTDKSRIADLRADKIGLSTADYPNNEIGRLVRGLDQYLLRLQGFLQRESHFAADVSHELRTPVAVIRGAAEILEAHPDLPAAMRPRLRTIHRQAIRMTELLEAMLLLSREEASAEEHDDLCCALADVVKDAVADCQPSLSGRPVHIVTEIASRPILPIERSLAYVVISNLLRNACAHTHEGRIDVRLNENKLEIVDTGIGIPADRFPTLFERHSKGEESSGNGLGLSIVARIADRLGWEVAIASESGAGTRVSVRFAAPAA